MSRQKSNQAGFTIIELMVATLTFSVILLILTVSVIQVGRMYYKGVISSHTQGSARTVIDTISRSIQFSQNNVNAPSPPAGSPTIGVACIGSQRYTYALNAQVDDSPGSYSPSNHKFQHALWQDTFTGPCVAATMNTATPPGGTNGKEMLESGARLTKFNVSAVTGYPNLWKVEIGVLYGDDDLVKFSDAGKTTPVGCKSGVSGSQWCALSELATQVNKRVQ
jgi:type II secretory pathway pseudopilin PulG